MNDFDRGLMQIAGIVLVVGVICGIATTRLYLAIWPAPKVSQSLSACKPSAGQCAYDGSGVYCLLPADKTPVRTGEKK